jgi:hypothetical protein
VNKKLVIEEIAEPKAKKEVAKEVAKNRELTEYEKWAKIPIEQLRREYNIKENKRKENERRNISRKIVKEAINKITKNEREIQKLTRSIIGKVIRKNAIERQAARNRLPPPRSERPYAGPRVRTSARNMYEHKTPRAAAEPPTYKRLRGEGLSERQARALINVFGYDNEPKKKEEPEENLANYLERWERESLKYPSHEESEEYAGGFSAPMEPFRRQYGSSIQIPVQLRRKHRPDYKLYSSYR